MSNKGFNEPKKSLGSDREGAIMYLLPYTARVEEPNLARLGSFAAAGNSEEKQPTNLISRIWLAAKWNL